MSTDAFIGGDPSPAAAGAGPAKARGPAAEAPAPDPEPAPPDAPAPPAAPAPWWARLAGEIEPRRFWTMALAAFLVMFIEIVDFAVIHYVSNYLQASSILSVALLGIALGGLVGWYAARRAPERAYLAFTLVLLASQVAVVAHVILRPDTLRYPISLAVPFFALGGIIALVFAQAAVHRSYFAELGGAALGAVAAAPALTLLREEGSLLLALAMSCGLLAVAPGAPSGAGRRRRVAAALAALLVAATVANLALDFFNLAWAIRCPKGDRQFGSKVFCLLERRPDTELWHSRGNVVARVDVAKIPPYPLPQVYQEGITSDHVTGTAPKGFAQDARLQPGLMDKPKVLVVGTSAEGITKTARHMAQGERITGVEINSAIVDLMEPGGPLYKMSARAYDDVDLHVMDARSFLRGSDERYDVMTFMNAHTRGRVHDNVGRPEYLHTVEAVRDKLAHLTDRGVIYYEEIRSNPAYAKILKRLLATFCTALEEELQVTACEDHLYGHRYTVGGLPYFIFVMSRQPFRPEYTKFLKDYVRSRRQAIAQRNQGARRRQGVQELRHVLIPGERLANPYGRWIYEKGWTRLGPGDPDLAPLRDDRPFLYDTERAHTAVWDVVRTSGWLALLLVLAPVLALFVLRFRDRPHRTVPHVAYFGLLGVGFLLLEVTLIQQYQLFLGFPVASLVVVLASMLLFPAIGGLVSARLGPAATWACLLGIPVLSLGLHAAAPAIFATFQSAPLPGRILVTLVTLFPLFFCMGVPFPLGLARVKAEFSAEYAALLYGVNGAAATLGSTLAMALSVTYGYGVSFLFGAAAYTAALLLVPLLGGRPPAAA